MLTIDNVTKQFGTQVLFRNSAFAIGAGQRVGLIGPNGAGKTTFFRMLMGEEAVDGGEIRTPKNYRIALLRQEWLPPEGDTVLEAALSGFAEWYRASQTLTRLERQLSDSRQAEDEKVLAQYHKVEHEFTVLGGHGVEQQAKEILSGLGFGVDQFDQPATQLSGGWRIRCHLAGLLLQHADLLLLDEPTNHLDIRSVKWFEEFLSQYAQTYMLISHDRRLVQQLASSILEFTPPQLTLWPGAFNQFESLKQQRIEQLEATIGNQQREIERLQDFARRFRAKATKARQSQNRLKTAEHYQKQVDELMQSMPVVSRRPASFRIDLKRRQPRVVMDFKDAVFGYSQDVPLFALPQCPIEGGKKIGIVGVNGVGKSTFLKSCAGELPLLQGKAKRQDQVSIGFFAQHRMEELPRSTMALDYLNDQRYGNTPQTVRTLAASLGLSADDVDKPIEVLSGGEKARVSLTRILLSHPELLLLDEPTNHLDMQACDALKQGLASYEGTLLVVSHNRDFLDSLVDYILEIRPGEAVLHIGNYSDWFSRQEEQKRATAGSGAKAEPGQKGKPSRGQKRSEQKRLEAQQRQRRSEQMKALCKRMGKAESDLKKCTEEIAALDRKLCLPESTKDPKFADWLRRHAELTTERNGFEELWLQISEEVERASSG